MNEHKHRAAEIAYRRGNEGAQDNQRFGADDGDQPPTMNDVGSMGGVEKSQDREAEIDQNEPDQQCE